MGIIIDIGIIYVVCWIFSIPALFLIGILKARIDQKGKNKIVDDFFKYVEKGRRRVPLYGDALNGLVACILFLFPIYLILAGLITYALRYRLAIAIVALLLTYYALALIKDRKKSSRHNGVAIGYEYMHPVEKKETVIVNGTANPGSMAYAGSKGVYDLPIKSEPSPHIMIVGKSGEGKSTTIMTLLIRAYAKHETPFLIIDWTGEYRKLDKVVNLWNVPKNLHVNPLLLSGMSKERRSGIAAEVLQFALDLTHLQAQKVRDLLLNIYDRGEEPTIQALYREVLANLEAERFRDLKVQVQYVANKLRQAFEVFGDEPNEFWENYDKTCNVVELNGLTDMEKGLITYSIMQRITEEFKSEGKIKLFIALDDAYQVIKNRYDMETPITRIVREGRKYGFGLVIATQMLHDLPDPIIANTSIKIIHSNHEPDDLIKVHKILHMTEIEKEIMRRMPIGHCFVFDENALQKGRAYAPYVVVDNLEPNDIARIISGIKLIQIDEKTQMPISTIKVPELLKKEINEIPSVFVYRFLIAIYRTNKVKEAYKFVKEKHWILSDTTIYGNKSKPSLLDRAKASGYVNDDKLTGKALAILEPAKMIEKQGVNAGSEEHRQLMEKVIINIQGKGSFPFVLSNREAFDVGELAQDPKTKYLWDYKNIAGYEVQTTAINDEISRCIERSKLFGTRLYFVSNAKEISEQISKTVNGKYDSIVI